MEIRLYATLRQIAGAKIEIEACPGQTVGDALRALTAQHPRLVPSIWRDDGALAGHLAVMLDGRDIRHLNGVDTPLSGARHLDVFPPVGGG